MSGIMDKVEGAVENNANQDAQPGNSVEKEADSYANNGKHGSSSHNLWHSLTLNVEVNDLAGDVGVPQQDDKMLDTVVDDKVNNDIPFGNN